MAKPAWLAARRHKSHQKRKLKAEEAANFLARYLSSRRIRWCISLVDIKGNFQKYFIKSKKNTNYGIQGKNIDPAIKPK
jgi:hypothetical protein